MGLPKGRVGKGGAMKRNIARERDIKLSRIQKRYAKRVDGEDHNVHWQPDARDKKFPV